MKRTLTIVLDCLDEHCYTGGGIMCSRQIRSPVSGIWTRCGLFGEELIGDDDGRLLRCSDCLAAEQEAR